MRSQSSIATLASRDRIIIASCILLVTALAWTYLVHLDHQMSASIYPGATMANMRSMIVSSWGPSDFFFAFVMWSVMMIGMMGASAAPVLLLFAQMQSKRDHRAVPLTTLVFGLGYIVVWIGFSACAAIAQWALHQAALLSTGMRTSSGIVAAVLLVAAGAYQLLPTKSACLRQCQSPLGFLLTNWRDGVSGAFQMGLRHGIYCLGCCWAIMCVLFVVGVMNLAWVAALSVFILFERFGRGGALLGRIGGVAMIAFGFLLVAT